MQNSIRTRLAITFVALAASLLLVVGAVLAWQSYITDLQRALTLQSEFALHISAQVVSYMHLQESTLNEIVRVQGLTNLNLNQQTKLLSELLTFTDAFDSLSLLNSEGQEQIVTSRVEVVGQLGSRASSAEFTIPKFTGKPYYSSVRFSEETGEPFFFISIPILDARTGEVVNVLLANVRFKPIWDLLANISLEEGSNAYIVDSQDRIIAHNNPSVVLRNTLFTVPGQRGIYQGVEGSNVVLATNKITLGQQEFTIVAETPTSKAFTGIIRTEAIIAILLLLAVTLAGGLGWLAARQIVGPIEALASTAERVTAGDLSQKAQIHRLDEIGKLAIAFNKMTEQLQAVLTNLEQRVEERTQELQNRSEQLKAIADLARSIATIQETNQLLPEITRQVSERFGFYHVGIFLLNENKQYAVLQAANSEGGQTMLARGHRLGVGQQGIVGYVTSRGQARVALDVGEEAVYFNNPDLPDTHSEVALPLKLGQEIVGALDIQSVERNAFSQEDVNTFSILADQISVAIQKSQSLDQAQSALETADRATRQLTGQAWETFTRTMSVKGFFFGGGKLKPLKEARKAPEKDTLRVPIQVRGQEIANLVLEASEPDYLWQKDELAMIQAAAERAALALENARLLEDAQRRASREQTIGEIADSLSRASEVETILQVAAEELGRRLSTSGVTVGLTDIDIEQSDK